MRSGNTRRADVSDRSVVSPSKVYIILVNYNGWPDTLQCLKSLCDLNYPVFDVIIVDNHSADDSVARMKDGFGDILATIPGQSPLETDRVSATFEGSDVTHYRWVRRVSDGSRTTQQTLTLVENADNRGFAGGNNIGIRYALAEGDAGYVWLLNNDTVVHMEALKELVDAFEAKDSGSGDLAFCGSLIMDFDDRERVQAYGGAMVNRILGLTKNLLEGENLTSGRIVNTSAVPDYISGCSMLISLQKIPQTGLLDEGYFLYWEDTEWCFRCRKQGMMLAVADRSIVWHRRGSTSIRFPVVGFYNTRNCFRFYRKYLPAYLIPCLILKPLFFSAIALRHSNYRFFRESMRGYIAFLREWRQS